MVVRVEDVAKQVKPKFVPRNRRGNTVIKELISQQSQSNSSELPQDQPAVPESGAYGEESSATPDLQIPEWRQRKEGSNSRVEVESEPKFGKKWTQKTRAEMTDRDWRVLAHDLGISITPPSSTDTLPLLQWRDLPAEVARIPLQLGYSTPTPVQRAAIPIALAGNDIVAVAETGSGKTASYLLPVIHDLLVKNKDGLALVLAPTRELAIQICDEATKYSTIGCVGLVGGRNFEDQVNLLTKKSVRLIVATPGRLLDVSSQYNDLLDLTRVRQVVLDEADRMLDMGFEDELNDILARLGSGKRQTMMYTATWPAALATLARHITTPEKPAVQIRVSAQTRKARSRIKHEVEFFESRGGPQRMQRVVQAVRRALPAKSIVFVAKQRECDIVAEALGRQKIRVATMHGSLGQQQRELALRGLRDGSLDCLVATDVVGRGIDLPDVGLVVNYELPNRFEMVIHRVGRTGRAGRGGAALTFVDEGDRALFPMLKRHLQESGNFIPDFLQTLKSDHPNKLSWKSSGAS